MKVTQYNKDAYLIHSFLSEEECKELVAHSEEKGYHAAKVNLDGRQVMMTTVRNNDRVLEIHEERAEALWERLKEVHTIKAWNSVPFGLNELFRFYRYVPGQRFKMHRDGSYERNAQEFSLFTVIIYLNEGFEGGETAFQDFSVQPKTGDALIFAHSLRHEGKVLESGMKYVLRTDIMYRLNEDEQDAGNW